MPVRVAIYTVAVPFLTAVAFAQGTPPTQPQQPAGQATPSMADKTAQDKSKDKNTDKSKDKDMDKGKTAGMASSGPPAEMKTQIYSGTLMDASCAGAGSTPSTSSSSTPSSSKPSATSASADRAAPSGDNQSCPISASTTQFSLKMKDGQTVKFDSVGNMRAQEAFKAHKKWNDSASASKPVRVKASGVLNGDRLTVISIN
jgi:hypothetical protein